MFSIWKVFLGQSEDEGWRRFLPFIILMILYGLSSLFKNKPKKKPPVRRPSPEPTRPTKPPATITRTPRLPSYARKRTTTATKPQSRQPAGKPRTSPTLAKPVPKSRSVERPASEAMETPRPKPRTQRSATPQAEAPELVRRTAPSSVRPATQTARHIQAEKKPQTTGQRPKPSRTPTSAKTAVRAFRSQRQHVSKPEAVVAKSLTATERLVERTSRKGALAQAILYGEILGTPMSLRPAGSHTYFALGSPGTRR